MGHLTHGQRGALVVFLGMLVVKSMSLSVDGWRTTGEIFRALKTTQHPSRELAWEVTDPRNSIYLLLPGMISWD